ITTSGAPAFSRPVSGLPDRRQDAGVLAARMAALLGLLLLFLVSPATAQRRHAVHPPAVPDTTPAGWLANHGYPLSDMEPLRAVIGSATVVGLGDATHGTHEFFDIKLRMIDFLVREMNFTTVGMEGPFVDFNRLNDYILGGSGDPHTILLHR